MIMKLIKGQTYRSEGGVVAIFRGKQNYSYLFEILDDNGKYLVYTDHGKSLAFYPASPNYWTPEETSVRIGGKHISLKGLKKLLTKT